MGGLRRGFAETHWTCAAGQHKASSLASRPREVVWLAPDHTAKQGHPHLPLQLLLLPGVVVQGLLPLLPTVVHVVLESPVYSWTSVSLSMNSESLQYRGSRIPAQWNPSAS